MRRLAALALALLVILSVPASVCEDTQEDGVLPEAYILVVTANGYGWLPLLEEEYAYPLIQILPDGSEIMNLIHVTPDGMYMEDSDCEGHDCMEQGMVTLENREERILGNMIICLPHQVQLYLYTLEEITALLSDAAGGEGV